MADLTHNAMSTLLLLGILQGWVMGIAMLISRGRRNGTHFLALAILAFSLTLLRLWSHMTGLWDQPGFWLMPLSFDLIIIALFWLYALSMTAASESRIRRHLWWLLPWAVFMVYATVVYLVSLTEPTMSGKGRVAAEWRFNEVKRVEDYLTVILNTVLGFMIWTRVNTYYRRVANWIPEHQAALLFYMRIMLLLLLASIVITIISFSAREFFERPDDGWIWRGTQIFYVLVIYVTGFLGFGLVNLPQFPREDDSDEDDASHDAESDNPAFEHLRQLMIQEDLYTNPDLNLNDLAVSTGMSATATSQLIKRCSGQNFRGFVNAYRIEAVKRQLRDESQADVSILAIALESGFNSESSFYRVFRAVTGHSPSDYRLRSTTEHGS